MLKTYIDVDRSGNGFILTVKHALNKKNEPVDTIVQVKHLGQVDHWVVNHDYRIYDLWPRTIESGDWDRFVSQY